jgi:hypothetical protein
MDPLLNMKIICKDEDGSSTKHTIFGNDKSNGKVVIRSNDNSELFYIDGACTGDSPLYVGLIKSRGNQSQKLPIESGDILGGLQVYGRIKPGESLGYNHNETPLCGSIMFKVSNEYQKGSNNILTELMFATGNANNLQIKLILDSNGNLKIDGNIEIGDLIITDEEVKPIDVNPKKYIKIMYKDKIYGMPLYQI